MPCSLLFEQASALYTRLPSIAFSDANLAELGVPAQDATRRFEIASRADAARAARVVWRGTDVVLQV